MVICILARVVWLLLLLVPYFSIGTHISYSVPTTEEPLLPRSVTPSNYYLKLHPYISEGYFTGNVHINITCREPTHTIVLHAHEDLSINTEHITVRNAIQVSEAQSSLQISNVLRNGSTGTLVITLQEDLHINGLYELYLEFNSNISNEYEGFFRGRKNTENQEESWYAGLFMHKKYARRVFPCFDESSFKATFQISVARPSNLSTLSVMPLASTENAEEGWLWDHFPPTPPLSVHSISVFISDLEADDPITVTTKHGNLSIQFHHTHLHNVQKLRKGRKTAHDVMKFLQEFLDIPYPISKLDIVAIPEWTSNEDRNALGLILTGKLFTGREDFFIYDLTNQFVFHIITPHGFSDYKVTNMLGTYLVNDAHFQMDDMENMVVIYLMTHQQKLYEQFSSLHQNISSRRRKAFIQEKGYSFLRMLNSSLGEDTFKRGLQKFISENMFDTFTEDSLWDVLTHQAHTDEALPNSITVQQIAEHWLQDDNLNFPVVIVTRNYDDNTAHLQQHVFTKNMLHNLTEEEQGFEFWIPISYFTPDNLDLHSVQTVSWMKEKNFTISNLPDSNSFIIANPADTGLYVVNYDQHNWDLISQSLLDPAHQFPIVTRSKIVHDAFILAIGGKLNFATFLNMTLFLQNERTLTVWLNVISTTVSSFELYKWTSIEDKYNGYLRHALVSLLRSINKTDIQDEFSCSIYKGLQNAICMFGHQECIDDAIAAVEIPIHSVYDNDTQTTILCPEFMNRNSDNHSTHFNELFEFVTHIGHKLKEYALRHMEKCPNYVNTIERILDGVVNGNYNLSSYEWYTLVEILNANPTAHNITFSCIMQHFNAFQTKFAQWSSLLEVVTGKFNTQEGLNELTEFYNQYKSNFSETELTLVEESIQTVKIAVEWGKKNLPASEYWFDHVLPNYQNTNGN